MEDTRPPTAQVSPAPTATATPGDSAISAQSKNSVRSESAQSHTGAPGALWGRDLMIGGTFGLGAPAGLAGLLAQINPSARWGASLSGGVGTLGPAAALQGWLHPVPPAGEWTPTVGAGLSINLISGDQRGLPDRDLPLAARWFNVEVGSEWRVASGRVMRVGLGHAFLLNGGDFRCRAGVEGSCQAISENNVPGWAPYGGGVLSLRDLIISQAQDRLVHLWFLHIDFAAYFPI